MSAFLLLTVALCVLSCSVRGLDPNCAPGGNFDLSIWNLQLPTGDQSTPDTIKPAQLEGCSGYQDPAHAYFYTNSGDGALVMKVPGSPASSGCVTTENSLHCRTELREITPSSWDPNAAVNRLRATLVVEQPDESKYGTVIGQIHIDGNISSKPVAELYYNSTGHLTMGVQLNITGSQVRTAAGYIAVGTSFTYEIRYESNVLSLSLNDGVATTFSTNDLGAPLSYFKAGNYNQGDAPSEVHFFAISVQH